MRIESVCFLLFCLAVPSAICSIVKKGGAVSSSAEGKVCRRSMNPFMPSLLSQGVKLNTEPVLTTNRCGMEWKTHGTCCDEASLIKFVTEEDNQLVSNSNNLLTEVRLVISAIRQTLFKMESQKSKFEGKKKVIDLFKAAFSVVGDFFKSLVKNIGDLAQLQSDFNREKQDIEQNQSGCLRKVQKLRASSLCSVCSARSHVFFFEAKAIIGMPTCRSVIDACHEYWVSLVRLIKTASRAAESINKARKILQIPPKTSAIEYLKDWIEKKNLALGLANCKSAQACSDTDAGFICESMIRIQDDRSIESRTTSVLSQQVKSFERIAKLVDPLNLNQDMQSSNFRRRLAWGAHEGLAEITFGDVHVVPDSQYLDGLIMMDLTLVMP